ncbi:hypothetical protein DFH09DRAFT_1302278 [Mycena vulgaris]|nr:hypothetical protein DFH09DRAFT_1302278 [Mycena vulgaris]
MRASRLDHPSTSTRVAAPLAFHVRCVIYGVFIDSLILPELDELLIAADCPPVIPMMRRSQCHLRKSCLIRCFTTESRAIMAGIPTSSSAAGRPPESCWVA